MKEEKIQYYEGVYVDEFPIGPYFRDKFNTIPSNLRYDYTFKYNKLIEVSHPKSIPRITFNLRGGRGIKQLKMLRNHSKYLLQNNIKSL